MSDLKYGEVDWNSGDAGSGGKKAEFMKLTEGSNVVRIMANPIQYYVHWLELPDGSRKKLNSPVDSPDLVRKLEDAGFGKKASWLVKVLDRKDDTFKILEIGSQIYNGVKALFNNPKWGKVTQYDVTINKGPKGAQPLYTVTPDPKEPLDKSLQDKFVKFNDQLNIDRLISPSDPKHICELLGWDSPAMDMGDAFESTASTEEEGEFQYDFK